MRPKAPQPELSTSVESYSASLAAYLEAARHGTLDAEIIDRLIAAQLEPLGPAELRRRVVLVKFAFTFA
jgi:hypothetical protein